VKTKARKIGVAKTKRERSKRGGRKEMRGKSREKIEKSKKGKNNRGEEDG